MSCGVSTWCHVVSWCPHRISMPRFFLMHQFCKGNKFVKRVNVSMSYTYGFPCIFYFPFETCTATLTFLTILAFLVYWMFIVSTYVSYISGTTLQWTRYNIFSSLSVSSYFSSRLLLHMVSETFRSWASLYPPWLPLTTPSIMLPLIFFMPMITLDFDLLSSWVTTMLPSV